MLIGLAGAYLIARFRAKTARGLADQILATAKREADTIRKQGRTGRQGRGPQAPRRLRGRDRSSSPRLPRARAAARETSRHARPEARADQPQGSRARRPSGARWPTSRRNCGSGRPRSSKRSPISSRTCSGSAASRRDDAREMLLKRIEDELSREVGSLILKHQAIGARDLPAEEPRDPDDHHPALRRVAHRRDRPSARSISPTTR